MAASCYYIIKWWRALASCIIIFFNFFFIKKIFYLFFINRQNKNNNIHKVVFYNTAWINLYPLISQEDNKHTSIRTHTTILSLSYKTWHSENKLTLLSVLIDGIKNKLQFIAKIKAIEIFFVFSRKEATFFCLFFSSPLPFLLRSIVSTIDTSLGSYFIKKKWGAKTEE